MLVVTTALLLLGFASAAWHVVTATMASTGVC